MDRQINVFGILIPSDSPFFLFAVGIHVLFGLACVVFGTILLLQKKGTRLHVLLGTLYFYGMLGVFVTAVLLSILRWPFDNHLLLLGVGAFVLTYIGRQARKRNWKNWAHLHSICMCSSFIVLLTAFYVDNGKSLPLWNLLPEIYYWILPGSIGVPILLYSLWRNPYTRSKTKHG